MQAFTVHQGRAVTLWEDNINTDQILPSRYLSRIEKTGYDEFLFANWRYLLSEAEPESRKANPDFPLNWPEHAGATILVTGNNFAGGSSREHAVWALDNYGFRVVIAGSFSDIFYMNSLKNGLLAISLGEAERKELKDLPATEEIEVDLVEEEIRAAGRIYPFKIDEEWRHKLLHGIDDITMTLEHEKALATYEDKWDGFYAN